MTRTFTSSVPLVIPGTGSGALTGSPASVYPSAVQVNGFNQGRILKVRASLIGLSHTFPADVDVMLVAPGNTKGVILMSDVGGTDDVAGITLIFDQSAPGRLPDPLVSGVFQPANEGIPDAFPAPAPAGVTGHSLNVFNNSNPNGLWRLYVVDDAGGSTGSLLGWSVTIRAKVRIAGTSQGQGQAKAKPKNQAKGAGNGKAKAQPKRQARANRVQRRPKRR